MAELTTIPTEYGFADQGFLADGLQPGATTAKIAPIFRTDNGVREARGFSTPRAFIFIELAGEYERASYGAMSVDPITKVTTLTDMRRELSQEDGSDFTSHGPGGRWPKGARVVVSNDPALFGSYAVTGGGNTFTALQTFSAGIDVTGKYIKSPVFADATARDAAIPSPANGMVCFVTGVGLQFYSGGSWNTVGSATVFNASTTVAGIVEEATLAEVSAGTATGGSGARLFINPSLVKKNSTGAAEGNPVGLNASIQIDSTLLPNIPVSKLNSGTGATALTVWHGDGQWKSISATRKIISQNSNVSIGGNIGEFTFLTTTIAAGSLSTSNVLKGTVYVSQLNAGGAGTLTVRLKYGATTMITHSISLAGINYGLGTYEFEVRAAGTTSSQEAQGILNTCVNSVGTLGNGIRNWAEGTAAIDSTVDQTLAVTFQYSTTGLNCDCAAATVLLIL